MSAPTHEPPCPPNILAKFLRVIYGSQAITEAERRASQSSGIGRDAAALWRAAKSILEKGKAT